MDPVRLTAFQQGDAGQNAGLAFGSHPGQGAQASRLGGGLNFGHRGQVQLLPHRFGQLGTNIRDG